MADFQKRRTSEEMLPVVEAWRESGMSKKAFYQDQDTKNQYSFMRVRNTLRAKSKMVLFHLR